MLVFVAVVASAALCAGTFPSGPARLAAHAARVQVAAPHPAAPDSSAVSPRAVSVRAGAPADAEAVAIASATPQRAIVPTMSMDAPIQGGLTVHQEQALSARLVKAHQTPAPARKSVYWTPAIGLDVVARAQSWLGMPYSWAGGSTAGPTSGRCDPGTGGDLDCHVVGFDCSGLAMYAWGAYQSLPHLAAAQQNAGGYHPAVKQLLPGDLVFFSGYLAGGTGHVAVYAGNGMVIEAPQSGSVVHRAPLSELIANDGYRGAVRPLTGQTPTLRAIRATVPDAGGTLTLHGTHLASVDAVHVGTSTVRRFTQRPDSAIVLRVPAHEHGTVTVTVSTSWLATSRPVQLSYAKPRPTVPVKKPTVPVKVPSTPVKLPTAPVNVPTPPVTHPAPTPPVTHPAPPTPVAPVGPTAPVSSTPAPPSNTSSTAPVSPHAATANSHPTG